MQVLLVFEIAKNLLHKKKQSNTAGIFNIDPAHTVKNDWFDAQPRR